MIVGLQGVQGCGKSYVGAQLDAEWETLSLDDFYLPDLSRTRGPPGTHDIHWLKRVLDEWKLGVRDICVPVFDKSLRGGQGNRCGTRRLSAHAKHLLLEGWCLGFLPLHEHDRDVREYDTVLRPRLDGLIVLHPPSLNVVYSWRLQSETVLDEAAVHAFVDEYLPYYRAYLPQLNADTSAIHLFMDDSRKVYRDPLHTRLTTVIEIIVECVSSQKKIDEYTENNCHAITIDAASSSPNT